MEMTRVVLGQRDAAHAGRIAALEDAHVADREADALARRRGQQHVVGLGAGLHADDRLALAVELHGDLAVAVHLDEVGELVAAHGARLGGEHHVELAPALLVLGQRQDRGDALVRGERQQVDQRLAARLRRGQRQPPDLLLVDDAARGEEQDRRVGIGDEQAGDEILLLGRHAGAALAAAPLRPVGVERHALDPAGMGDGHHHVLALDEVLVLEVGAAVLDHGLARRRELVADRLQLVLDDRRAPAPASAGCRDSR